MKRLDRSTSVAMADLHPDDQISLPVPRYSAILYLYRATRDHDLFADMSPRFSLGSGSSHAQSTPYAQIAHQFALEGASALNAEAWWMTSC